MLKLAIALALVCTASAQAQDRGEGSGKSSTTLPAERSAGPREELAERPAGRPPLWLPAIDKPSGDLIRSWSSSDVRETRRQDAPDLALLRGSKEPARR